MLQQGFEAGMGNGFKHHPDAADRVEDFVDHVVPILQRRGLFRTEYEGTTLREHLGIPYQNGLPESHPGALRYQIIARGMNPLSPRPVATRRCEREIEWRAFRGIIWHGVSGWGVPDTTHHTPTGPIILPRNADCGGPRHAVVRAGSSATRREAVITGTRVTSTAPTIAGMAKE
jgi:hypothetical protein